MKLLSLLLLLTSCAHKEHKRAETSRIIEASQVSETIRPWVLRCPGGIACKEGERGDGDSLLWAGLLCLSGEVDQCGAALASQGPDGRIWRSPARVGVDTGNTASRDMLLGFLAYLITTKDVEAARKLDTYLQTYGELCPGPFAHCELTPTILGVMYEVYGAIGIVPSADMKKARPLMEIGLSSAVEAELGYQLHLVGVELLILKRLGIWGITLDAIAARLAQRQPDNPFFQFVYAGASEACINSFLSKVPKEKPGYLNQWSWERDTAQAAWKDSMGWEFIFLGNLIK